MMTGEIVGRAIVIVGESSLSIPCAETIPASNEIVSNESFHNSILVER